mmetsp:Transcript_48266/g.113452  ORF Transcript_48266/g.113452 Transcript_48266/m.113452 type:complete len:107 (+) Transcript_48266:26-346(+)
MRGHIKPDWHVPTHFHLRESTGFDHLAGILVENTGSAVCLCLLPDTELTKYDVQHSLNPDVPGDSPKTSHRLSQVLRRQFRQLRVNTPPQSLDTKLKLLRVASADH